MKNLKSILFLGIIAGLTFGLFSCDGEEPDPVESEKPTMTFTVPSTTVFDVSRGQDVDFSFTVFSNKNTNKAIEEVLISVEYAVGAPDDTTYVPSSSEDKQYPVNHTYTVPSAGLDDGDQIKITITATDKAGQYAEKVFTLTVINNSGLSVYENVQLGAQDNASYGSFYSTSLNQVYLVTTVSGRENKVDMVYFYGSSNAATIASPDNDDVFGSGAGKISSLGVHDWTVRNTTRFKVLAPMAITEWGNMDASKVQSKYVASSSSELNMANSLTDNTGGGIPSFIGFKTNKNKYGIFKVEQITDFDATGSIIVTVKIQK